MTLFEGEGVSVGFGVTEKRPFFLESSDLLVSPTDALYTRSVNDPRWGLRATWRGERASGTAMESNR